MKLCILANTFVTRIETFLEFVDPESAVPTTFTMLVSMMSLCTTHIKRDISYVKCHWSIREPGVLLVKGRSVSLELIKNAVGSILTNAIAMMNNYLLCGLEYSEVSSMLPLDCISDDIREDDPGYSFLSTPTVSWIRGLLADQIYKDSDVRNRFLVRADDQFIINDEESRRYLKKVQDLLKLLLALIQLTAGNLARGTEMSTIQWKNSGSQMRSIFVYESHVLLLPRYNKTSAVTQTDRPIARFLPAEVGQLLIVTIALVIPFAR